ncbi:MAG: Fe-S cluster assembly sulfur transfer protein SufU [Actinomycetota bacterium]
MAALDELYKEVILDHYKNPRNKREMDAPTVSRRKNNPLCGDEIEIHALVDDGVVKDVTFVGQGCSISQASASMLTESIQGKPLGEATALAADFRGMMEGRVEPDDEAFGDLVALKGVAKYPVRIKCAVLAWDILQEALDDTGGGSA